MIFCLFYQVMMLLGEKLLILFIFASQIIQLELLLLKNIFKNFFTETHKTKKPTTIC